ncbi:M14 family metallopeptidase [Bacillus sp. FJAT-45066]|uniref:M14 family metallopeptidase n=1 Tax=Bacillus sp. FJAT-45066 TaxID=2011010 RepID=UPI0015968A90|nr:M14 family zinc carboxypeptidase [Bacillus sp. FJAT-45066]
MKRIVSLFTAIVLLVSLYVPITPTVQANYTQEVTQAIELEVSKSIFSFTEVRTVEVQADFGENVDLSQLKFTFGGKDLSEWKKWTSGTNFNGAPIITVVEAPHFVEDTTVVKATLEFGLPFNTTNLSNRTIRVQYPQLIGDYELALINKDTNEKVATTVKWNVYDEFLFNEEIKPAIDEVFAKASADVENSRYIEYESVGKSVEGRDIHFVVLAKDKAAVDKYLNETLPTALENPASLIEKLQNGTMKDYQVPIWFNNIHPDEVEGVDAQVALFKKFALEKEVTFTTSDEENKEKQVTLNVDEVLEDVIMLYLFTSNPDGRVANTRANVNGFDLNRDNAYQTQVETQAVNEVIAKWTPLSFLDMHGYVNGFLIEPTTPPHNPNFEYDLLHGSMISQAHAMGKAGVGNSNLTSYFIPKLSWEDGWDDMTPAYTAVFSMLHGSLGHTIEVPTLSQDSLHAMVGTGYGATLFVTENKDELYKKQLEVFKRGVNGEDNRAVDPYYVNAKGESIGRVRGENESFFPDYYVIPTGKNQKNVLEAEKMVQYLLRNGVKVEKTTESTTVNGTTYPKGTFVVPMKQAKRGLANAVLYKGDDVSDWGAMYDPIVVNFPALRGFDIHEIRTSGAFTKTVELAKVELTKGTIVGNTPKQALKNSNNDTIKLVNELLKNGKEVQVALKTNSGVNKGDFIVNSADLLPYVNVFYFEATSLVNTKNMKTNKLSKPNVAVTGSAQLLYSVKELGFNVVDVASSDVVVSDNNSFNVNNIAGKSYIGIGRSALLAVQKNGLLPGYSYGFTNGTHEGLVHAKVNNHLLTAGYNENELLYVTSGSWINSVPEGAEVLASFSDQDDFYVSGWWPKHDGAKGKIMAFTKELENTTITLFANSLAFRAHTEHSYRLLANSIYAAVGEEVENVENDSKVITVEDLNMDLIKEQGNTLVVSNGESITSAALQILSQELENAKLLIELDGQKINIPLSALKLEEDFVYTVEDVTAQFTDAKSKVYDIEISNLTGTVNVSFLVEASKVTDKKLLKVIYVDSQGNREVKATTITDLDNGYYEVSASVNHFSIYGVFEVVEEEEPVTGEEPPVNEENPATGEEPPTTGKQPEETKAPKTKEETKKDKTKDGSTPAKDGKKLPGTATTIYNTILIGLGLLLVGVMFILFKRKRKLA